MRNKNPKALLHLGVIVSVLPTSTEELSKRIERTASSSSGDEVGRFCSPSWVTTVMWWISSPKHFQDVYGMCKPFFLHTSPPGCYCKYKPAVTYKSLKIWTVVFRSEPRRCWGLSLASPSLIVPTLIPLVRHAANSEKVSLLLFSRWCSVAQCWVWAA